MAGDFHTRIVMQIHLHTIARSRTGTSCRTLRTEVGIHICVGFTSRKFWTRRKSVQPSHPQSVPQQSPGYPCSLHEATSPVRGRAGICQEKCPRHYPTSSRPQHPEPGEGEPPTSSLRRNIDNTLWEKVAEMKAGNQPTGESAEGSDRSPRTCCSPQHSRGREAPACQRADSRFDSAFPSQPKRTWVLLSPGCGHPSFSLSRS